MVVDHLQQERLRLLVPPLDCCCQPQRAPRSQRNLPRWVPVLFELRQVAVRLPVPVVFLEVSPVN
jgi:hypothetical protein